MFSNQFLSINTTSVTLISAHLPLNKCTLHCMETTICNALITRDQCNTHPCCIICI